jgi:nucleotide-binding universal stress UspA family protein
MAADLLVLGTHGRSGFERLLLGSVAERVLRKASCPVLTVPKGDAGAVNEALYRTILCPVDFSESSMRALQYALSLTQEADAQLIVMHVVAHELERSSDAAVIAYDAGMTVGNFVKEREEELRTHLLKASAGAGGNEYSRVESLLTHDKPWREILRVAGERQTDLIVMGVQGRGASDPLFFGSTTQHVVREASCPVLTLRHG